MSFISTASIKSYCGSQLFIEAVDHIEQIGFDAAAAGDIATEIILGNGIACPTHATMLKRSEAELDEELDEDVARLPSAIFHQFKRVVVAIEIWRRLYAN